MASILPELRLALRRLLREPGFSGPAVTTLAVGIGIAASAFALVEGILIRPLPYPDSGRLVSIRHVAPGIEITRDGMSPGMWVHYRDGNRVFEAISAYETTSYTFTGDGEGERIRTGLVKPGLFDVLEVTPQLGRLPSLADWSYDFDTRGGTFGGLISHDLWVRRYAADPSVIGRVITVDGEPSVEVVGVAPEGFSFPDPQTEAWFVIPAEPWSDVAVVRQGMYLESIARLRPGVTVEDAEADLERLVALLPERFSDVTEADLRETGLRAIVRPYKEVVVADVRPTLLLVLASGAFLLLVTCANVANLLLLRTHGRRLGMGVARALGASEWNVARQLLIESLVLTVSGSLFGLALADLATASRFGFEPHQIPRLGEVGVSAPVVALVAALALLGALFMAAVCFFSTRRQVAGPALSSMRSRSATDGHEGQTGRRVLVAAQMAMALTLLIGSGLMARTYWQLQRVDMGFESRDRLSFRLSTGHLGLDAGYGDMSELHARVLQRLRTVPGVEAVEAGSIAVFPLVLPDAIDFQPIVPAEGPERAGTPQPQALVRYATSGYFDAMGIPLISGRRFEIRDASLDAPGVIVSRSLADALFGDAEPLGRAVRFADFSSWSSLTVVGVVGDVPGRTVREGASRAIYLPHVHPAAADVVAGGVYRYRPDDERYVVRTARDFASVVPELRRAAQEVDPRLPLLDITPVDEIVGEAAARERVVMRVLVVSAAAALFLGVVGVYGVLGYAVRRRTAELGIRLALGASPERVIRQIVAQGTALSTAGIVAGIAAALLLTRFMAALLYRTSPTDPVTFTATALLLLAVSLAASYLPALRASCIDPAQALRSE